MGYDTIFKGFFLFDRPLAKDQILYLKKFANTRRMRRNPEIAKNMEDLLRLAVDLPVGIDGEFFVGGRGFAGQDKDESVIMSNNPPRSQPGLWCDWEPNESGTKLRWNKKRNFMNIFLGSFI